MVAASAIVAMIVIAVIMMKLANHLSNFRNSNKIVKVVGSLIGTMMAGFFGYWISSRLTFLITRRESHIDNIDPSTSHQSKRNDDYLYDQSDYS